MWQRLHRAGHAALGREGLSLSTLGGWKHPSNGGCVAMLPADQWAASAMALRASALSVQNSLTGHILRMSQSSLPFQMLALRDLAWWHTQQRDHTKVKDKWHGAHPFRFSCWRKRVSKSISSLHPDPRTVGDLHHFPL